MALYYDYLWSRDSKSNLTYAATGHTFGIWTPSASAALGSGTAATLLQRSNINSVMTIANNQVTITGNVNVTGTVTTVNGVSGSGSGGSGGVGSNASSLTTGTLSSNLLPSAFSVNTNTQTLVITSAGTVGIGTSTTSLSDLLTINGSTRTSNLVISGSRVTSNCVLVTDSGCNCISSGVTSTELGTLSGIGNQSLTYLLGLKQNIIGLTPYSAVISDGTGKLTVSTVTSTELGYLHGVTSSIQTQLSTPVMTNKIINSDMRIDQRISAISPVTSGYCVDRFKIATSNLVSGGVTAGQVQLIGSDQASTGGLSYATAITAAPSNIPASNLQIYCPFESSTGISDVSGVVSGLNLTIKGTVQYVSGYNGQGTALSIANTSSSSSPNIVYGYYSVASNTALTISMYLQFTVVPPASVGTPKFSYPIAFGSDTTAGLALVAAYNSSTSAILYSTINNVGNSGASVVNINTWYHVSVVYIPGVSYSLYINGSLGGTYAGTPNPVPTSLPYNGKITLGDGSPTQVLGPFGGYIDELRVYNRALSVAEIGLLAGTNLPTYVAFQQPIEGYDIADLAWGTATASPVTISYYIKNNTGYAQTFTTSLNNGTQRYYLTNTPSISANSWCNVTATIPGDVTGTWKTDSNLGMNLSICIGANIQDSSASNSSWNAISGVQPIPYTSSNIQLFGGSPTNFLATPGNSLYITGVQLQKGSTSTLFNMRTYATELQMCQRYYEKSYDDAAIPGSASANGSFGWAIVSGNRPSFYVPYKVTKRVAVTPTIYNPFVANSLTLQNIDNTTSGTYGIDNIGAKGFKIYWAATNSGQTQGQEIAGHFVVNAEL